MIDAVRTVAPVGYPVSLPEAKAHLRVTSDDENGVIQGLIAAATDYLEGPDGILGRAILPQTWQEKWDGFQPSLRLRMGPVIGLVSLSYVDGSGDAQTVSNARIITSLGLSRVVPASGFSWPSGSDVAVEYIAGSATIPAPLQIAILLHIGALYANREAVSENALAVVPMAYHALIAPYRRGLV